MAFWRNTCACKAMSMLRVAGPVRTPEARAIGIEALLCADLGRVAGGAGIRDVVRHERQLALDIGQSAGRDR